MANGGRERRRNGKQQFAVIVILLSRFWIADAATRASTLWDLPLDATLAVCVCDLMGESWHIWEKVIRSWPPLPPPPPSPPPPFSLKRPTSKQNKNNKMGISIDRSTVWSLSVEIVPHLFTFSFSPTCIFVWYPLLKRHSFPTVLSQQLSISIDSGINQKQNKNFFFSYHTIPEDR